MDLNRPAPLNAKVLSEAAHWFALLGDDCAPSQARVQWQTWLDADIAHRQAWARVEQIGARIGHLQGLHEPEREHVGRILDRVGQQRLHKRRSLTALTIMAALGLGSWSALHYSPWAIYPRGSHRTATGERAGFTLADGSALWLNSASTAQVNYNAHERSIALLEGELWLQSGKDATIPARDLLVETPLARLRALGTQFSVWLDADAVDVSVYEGAVRIEPLPFATQTGLKAHTIAVGERVRFSAAGIQAQQAATPERQLWRSGVLLAQDIQLDAFLRELARHRRGRIDCAPEVANLHLIGVYRLDDTDAVLDSLAEALPIKVMRVTPWWIRVGAR
ncbi:DUF4880 domain-containing protein [Lampropedia puyangensis]|uniref:DUF4880 domain-containing protein n=1 Tax=Lampropedia puyangensis TaxID=1330072 RepID=A0A4S8F628_9BURK|nr:FecR domain-containing protein [Lampropedia puyangensis]THU02870.1 DUF4880 domain-containing protein [Lampropedia puyangensis]